MKLKLCEDCEQALVEKRRGVIWPYPGPKEEIEPWIHCHHMEDEMKLEFDADEVFVYDALNLTVTAVGKDRGHNKTVSIKFKNLAQVYHFKEMLEFIEEKLESDHVVHDKRKPDPRWPNEPCGTTLKSCPFDKQQHTAYHEAWISGKLK
jgi:hypothetical protein